MSKWTTFLDEVVQCVGRMNLLHDKLRSESPNSLNNEALESLSNYVKEAHGTCERLCNECSANFRWHEYEGERILIILELGQPDPKVDLDGYHQVVNSFRLSPNHPELQFDWDAIGASRRKILPSLQQIALRKRDKDTGVARRNDVYGTVFSALPKESLSPFERLILAQVSFDEIFGFGPIAPYLRIFGIVEMGADYRFHADGHELDVSFDNEDHRSQILGLFKQYPIRETRANGNVAMLNETRCGLSVPPELVQKIEDSKTLFDRKVGVLERLGLANKRK